MRRVQVKIKHLLLIAGLVVFILIIIVPNAVLLRAESLQKKDIEASKVLYKRYIDSFPFAARKGEALYMLAQSISPINNQNSRYKVFANGISFGGSRMTDDTINNAIKYYQTIIESYPNSKYYSKAFINLMDIYISNDMFEAGNKLIELGLASKDTEIRLSATKYKMLYLIIDREYSKAEEYGKVIISQGKADLDFFMLLGDIYFNMERYNDAISLYEKAKDSIKNDKNRLDKSIYMKQFENYSPTDKINLVNKIKNGYKGRSSIYGRVQIDGKPVPFIFIYLKEDIGGKINSIGDENSGIIAVTDFDGSFVINSLPDGQYILGAGMPVSYLNKFTYQTPIQSAIEVKTNERKEFNFNFVTPMKVVNLNGTVLTSSNKVDVEWEKVENAQYYLIKYVIFEDPEKMSGSYMKISDGKKINDTKCTINIEKLNKENFGYMTDDSGRINPQAYLGVFYPGGKIPFYVEAYDKNGALIKRSVAMRANFTDMTIIYIPQERQTESDKLVLEGKIEEAVKSYENDLSKNPDDIHSLNVLSMIYTLGTKMTESFSGINVEGRNMKRAVELNDKLFYLTKDTAYVNRIQNRSSYISKGTYNSLLGEYINISEQSKIEDLDLELIDYKRVIRHEIK